MSKIDPKFGKQLKSYGAFDFNKCYNCGTCTAVCSLADEKDAFPRSMVRSSAVGNADEISASLKPWLCYYCGECSEHCPQTANPGELMMSLRRWLMGKYDWTGMAGIFYRSAAATIIAMIVVLAGVIGFAAIQAFDTESIMHFGHYFEMFAIGGVLLVILMPNMVRMWYFTVIKPGKKIPFKIYLQSLGDFFLHMFTQKRALGCDDNKGRWFMHFILVLGYMALLMTTVFLDWFGTEYLLVNIFGYAVSITVFTITFLFVNARIRKKKELSKHSQPSDWFFVIWLFLMGFTAFAVRLFIDLGLIESNLWLYLFHLTVLAQWALIIVPFGKWTHFLYRSFAMYFHKLLNLAKA
ncbi:MAG TPA: 4Fe-4S dicluster domain-containing protein [Bacteroidales bacterium]|nr:4Fe-4S dicluster domain-containing protein [Bacteroidales bacterium]